jgi:hypothetical protein
MTGGRGWGVAEWPLAKALNKAGVDRARAYAISVITGT